MLILQSSAQNTIPYKTLRKTQWCSGNGDIDDPVQKILIKRISDPVVDFKVHVGIFFRKLGNIRHDGIYSCGSQTDTQDPFFPGFRDLELGRSGVFQQITGSVVEKLSGFSKSNALAGAVEKFYI